MISYMSIDRLEGDFAVCELNMVWVKDCKNEEYWKTETKMVDVPIEKFENCGNVSQGDIFVVIHNNGEDIEVCCKDEKEKARRIALKKALI